MAAVTSPSGAGRLARLSAWIRHDPGPVEVTKLTEPDYASAAGQVVAEIAAHTRVRLGPHTGREQISIDGAHGDLLDRIIEPLTRAWIEQAHRERDRIVGDLCERKNRETVQIARLVPQLEQARSDSARAVSVYEAMWKAQAPEQVAVPAVPQGPRAIPRPVTDEACSLGLLDNGPTESGKAPDRATTLASVEVLAGGGAPTSASSSSPSGVFGDGSWVKVTKDLAEPVQAASVDHNGIPASNRT